MLRQRNDARPCGASRMSALGQQRTMGGSIVTPVRPNSAYPRTLPSLIELFLGGPCGRYFVPRKIKNGNDEHSYYYDCHHLNPPVPAFFLAVLAIRQYFALSNLRRILMIAAICCLLIPTYVVVFGKVSTLLPIIRFL